MDNEYAVFKAWIAKTENAELLKKQKINELAKKWQEEEKGSIAVFIHCLKEKVPTDREVIEAAKWLSEKRNEALLNTDLNELLRKWIDEKGTNLNAVKAVFAEAGIMF